MKVEAKKKQAVHNAGVLGRNSNASGKLDKGKSGIQQRRQY